MPRGLRIKLRCAKTLKKNLTRRSDRGKSESRSGTHANPLLGTASSLFRPRWIALGWFSEVFSCALRPLPCKGLAEGARAPDSCDLLTCKDIAVPAV